MVIQQGGIRYEYCVACPKGQLVPDRLAALEDAVEWECSIRCDSRERSKCRTREHLEGLLRRQRTAQDDPERAFHEWAAEMVRGPIARTDGKGGAAWSD